MAHEFHTPTNMADFIDKLDTFLSGNGWTTFKDTGAGEFAARKTPAGIDIGFAAQWDTADVNHLGIYQFHGAAYDSAESPWDQNDDSGNGAATTTDGTSDTTGLGNERRATISDSPTAAWFFEDDHYFNVVVWREGTDTAAKFVQFGAGYLDKYNDWTGGEYVYGHSQDNTFNSAQFLRPTSSYLLDGEAEDQSPSFQNMEQRVATLHIEGMDNQAGTSKWGVVMGDQASGNLGTDRQGPAGGPKTNEARIHIIGGCRSGMHVPNFLLMRASLQKGLTPMVPIEVNFWNRTTDDVRPLGQMVGVKQLNIANYSAEGGDEIVVDGETWVVFPAYRKIEGSTVGASGNMGLAFKKVS